MATEPDPCDCEPALRPIATVLGACGTAYAMRYIRANIQGGIEIGFDANTANLIVAQTVKGASELLLQNGTHPEQEIDKVTTPKLVLTAVEPPDPKTCLFSIEIFGVPLAALAQKENVTDCAAKVLTSSMFCTK